MRLVRTCASISFKNILFLTDFGQASAGALAYSLAFARHFKARLYPAHVMDTVLTETAVAGEAAIKELEEQKRRQLSRLAEYNGINFQPLLSRCDFEAAMSHWISQLGIDLVVAGTHGRRGVQRLLLGSTSEMVLHNAPALCSRWARMLKCRASLVLTWRTSSLPQIWANNRSMFLDTLFHWRGKNARA